MDKTEHKSQMGGVQQHREQDESLRPALEALSQKDPDFSKAYVACGLPPERRQDTGFAGLIRIIAAQQVSAKAAAAIIDRLNARCQPLTPDAYLALPEETLREIGLSARKVTYGRILAEALLSGSLDLHHLHQQDDDSLISSLTALKGIGRWTADIYLLFSLRRPDVWPVGDLAVRQAAAHLKGVDGKVSPAWLNETGEIWRPHRSAAALFLWHYYRHPKGGGAPKHDRLEIPG